ncbi:MAG: DUF1553 domain-containing protein, partial [Planctomycetes bacterium]|nr:DUF1553 domain-containing protein [Planctomycetota bacterium]
DWRMKPLHRMIVLSSTYRMVSSGGHAIDRRAGGINPPIRTTRAASPAVEAASPAVEIGGLTPPARRNQHVDPDNRYLWRMNSRRMEAEIVRDSVLATSGALDISPGGPETPESEGQTVFRRSLYFRLTPNEKMKLLELFDAADPNQCYRRRESVVPQQSLALFNSGLAIDRARALAATLSAEAAASGEPGGEAGFVVTAFESVLSRAPTNEERIACERFLTEHTELLQHPTRTPFAGTGGAKRPPAPDPRQRARENLLLVLYNHNDFVTIR